MQHVCIVAESGGSKRPFALDDYFNDTVRWRSYNLYWISGILTLLYLLLGSIKLHPVNEAPGSLSFILCPCR